MSSAALIHVTPAVTLRPSMRPVRVAIKRLGKSSMRSSSRPQSACSLITCVLVVAGRCRAGVGDCRSQVHAQDAPNSDADEFATPDGGADGRRGASQKIARLLHRQEFGLPSCVHVSQHDARRRENVHTPPTNSASCPCVLIGAVLTRQFPPLLRFRVRRGRTSLAVERRPGPLFPTVAPAVLLAACRRVTLICTEQGFGSAFCQQ